MRTWSLIIIIAISHIIGIPLILYGINNFIIGFVALAGIILFIGNVALLLFLVNLITWNVLCFIDRHDKRRSKGKKDSSKK